MFYSFILFNDEEIVSGFFNKVKTLTSKKQEGVTEFEQLLNALVFFMGSPTLRENAILMLFVCVYQQLWIQTKVQKNKLPSG